MKLDQEGLEAALEIMMNTMVNYLREDPYFDGNEVELKLQYGIMNLKKIKWNEIEKNKYLISPNEVVNAPSNHKSTYSWSFLTEFMFS